jgi:cell fate regulator YaaT (PSP1 superfamily)
MSDVVGIRYHTAGPIDYCSPGDLQLGVGDYVVVEKDGGEHLGWVVLAADQVIAATIERPLRMIERIAGEDDVAAWERQKQRAEEDVGRAQVLAARTDPRMRVASVVYDLSGERGELSYTAQERGSSDWLRREAEELLDARLTIRQVGDRDRAKAMGAGVMGICGRDLCCSSWMTEFPSVSIRMAKDQGLAPNPSKISGLCGRLLCCLSFEVEAYRELRGDLPKVGKRVTTPVGRAKVLSIDALKQTVRIRLDETNEVIEIEAEQLRAQYGSLIRPEELESTVEDPARAEARELAAATIAILEPVDHPPSAAVATKEESDAGEASEDDQSKPRRRRRGRRGGRRRRGRAAGEASGQSASDD